MLQELHDVEFFVEVLCVDLRTLAGLERLDHHLPAVANLPLKAAFRFRCGSHQISKKRAV